MAKKEATPASNSIVSEALERLRQIDQDTQAKRQSELKGLAEARAKLAERIEELNAQMQMVDAAIEQISGRKTNHAPRARSDFQSFRPRLINWLQNHKGVKYSSTDLIREFPELSGKQVSNVIKPLLESGELLKEGIRNGTVYFVR